MKPYLIGQPCPIDSTIIPLNMPELDYPDWNEAPHDPGQEYVVEIGESAVFVHLDKGVPFVRMENNDFLSAEAYGKKYLRPSLREGFYRDVRYLVREFTVRP